MREIKFRGKTKDNKWIYGLFARSEEGSCIKPCIQKEHENDNGDWIENVVIDGNTLGQYTGLKDKNGKEIYEGDIVYDRDYENVAVVAWDKDTLGWVLRDEIDSNWLADMVNDGSVIIGNIYENADLLETKGK